MLSNAEYLVGGGLFFGLNILSFQVWWFVLKLWCYKVLFIQNNSLKVSCTQETERKFLKKSKIFPEPNNLTTIQPTNWQCDLLILDTGMVRIDMTL